MTHDRVAAAEDVVAGIRRHGPPCHSRRTKHRASACGAVPSACVQRRPHVATRVHPSSVALRLRTHGDPGVLLQRDIFRIRAGARPILRRARSSRGALHPAVRGGQLPRADAARPFVRRCWPPALDHCDVRGPPASCSPLQRPCSMQACSPRPAETVAWCVVFFLLQRQRVPAYLTVGEDLRLEIRALAIAVVYAVGTGARWGCGPFVVRRVDQHRRAPPDRERLSRRIDSHVVRCGADAQARRARRAPFPGGRSRAADQRELVPGPALSNGLSGASRNGVRLADGLCGLPEGVT